MYAHREDAPDHRQYLEWLEGEVNGEYAFGVSDLILSGFLRVVTHKRVFKKPSSMNAALEFARVLREHPNSVNISPGDRHWEIFVGFCASSGVKGNIVPDAYLAALAVESGSEWITTDRGFGRFSGLRWRHPLED